MILPDSVIRHVTSAPVGDARMAVNRVGGTTENPTMLLVMNGLATISLAEIIKHGVATAPTDEQRTAWKALGLNLTSAILGALVE